MKDQLYRTSNATAGSFCFDENVARIFDDMINRSVPGYLQIVDFIATTAKTLYQNSSHEVSHGTTYDLGCSHGVVLNKVLSQTNANTIGIDLSSAMIDKATALLSSYIPQRCEMVLADLSQFQFKRPARLIICNFTLQFIPIEKRTEILQKCYQALEPEGVLILSEKIRFEDPEQQALSMKFHHEFKASRGYNSIEIARKREALETILVPETKSIHLSRLHKVGFETVNCWYQHFNFTSFIAVKDKLNPFFRK